ncbi:cellulose synthase operon protein YhjQ/BcsQ [Moritella sp. F3]|uniref:tyrosine-protein kinase family protein n=1 Tax=Moritella sp. F3 TaxID=2718882 RepID=UPI0018E1BD54|nr:cellulose synthase operon protein YhjQ/BcsQ [Moritella sp. F3]GIC79602.1 chromosome partitioning ATPase [Moritella sp. F1]GIC79910.1 chromosome partitioning ATPase [Moritella sp. F3]
MNILPETFVEIEQIYQSIMSENIKSISINCAQGKEGSTELVLALARRYKAAGNKVLIVDLNTFKPAITNEYVKQKQSWSLDDTDLQTACITPFSEMIDILPAPQSEQDQNISFRDEKKLKNAIEIWLKRYNFIIFDTCAITRANFSNIPGEVIARGCDASLLVVAPGISLESRVLKTMEIFNNNQINLIGTVINDVECPPLDMQLRNSVRRRLKRFPRIERWLLKRISNIELLKGNIGR